MTDDRDPILDACLDEVLAGRRPPDLTARILQAWAARGIAGSRSDPNVALPGPAIDSNVVLPAAPPVIAASSNGRLQETTPANGQPVVELRTTGSRSRSGRRKSSFTAQAAMIAASVLAVAALAGVAYVASNQPQIANNDKPGKAPQQAVANNNTPAPQSKQAEMPQVVTPPNKPLDWPQIVQTPSNPDSGSPQVVDNGTPNKPVVPLPAPEYGNPSPDAEVVSFVNAELTQSWVEAGVKPSDPATDSEWCRRLFVRVLGRIPTVEELQSFLRDKSPEKREQLVDRLLTDDAYNEEYARHWAVVWSNILIGRTGGRGESLADRDGLEQYLRTSLANNKPFNQLVHELVTATG
ncbi:MAG TPA: DUF1549 domain-containing protein, partial [Pirellulaceae bacterium]|nr:DUF1549 domain-containing protein [Pirellulaceae bacterium]